MSVPPPTLSDTEIDGYTQIRKIGSGSMAEVYLVERDRDQRRFAIKLPHSNAPNPERADLEGILGGILDHPNVVPVVEVLRVEGRTALVMEYVDGPSLRDWLASNDPGFELALSLAHGLVSGVKHCHEIGLIHRDLNPSNVLVATAPDGQLVPRVTDFGLAKAQVLKGQTIVGTAMGTPDYAAPEQLRDASSVDARADVFSLGCLLYELFAAEPLFKDDNPYQRIVASKSAPAPQLTELAPDLPEPLVVLIRQMLATDPAERPSELGYVLERLEPYMPWLQAPEEPESALPGPVVLGGLVGVGLVAVVAVGLAAWVFS